MSEWQECRGRPTVPVMRAEPTGSVVETSWETRRSRFTFHKLMKVADCTARERVRGLFPPALPTGQSCGSWFQAKLPLPSPVVSGWCAGLKASLDLENVPGCRLCSIPGYPLSLSPSRLSPSTLPSHSLQRPGLQGIPAPGQEPVSLRRSDGCLPRASLPLLSSGHLLCSEGVITTCTSSEDSHIFKRTKIRLDDF